MLLRVTINNTYLAHDVSSSKGAKRVQGLSRPVIGISLDSTYGISSIGKKTLTYTKEGQIVTCRATRRQYRSAVGVKRRKQPTQRI